jgi:hypothetical protein
LILIFFGARRKRKEKDNKINYLRDRVPLAYASRRIFILSGGTAIGEYASRL